MHRNLDIALLRTFVTVAERASMTSAAAVLHVTQGAVSQQIKRLEAALGWELLHRDRTGLRLTPAGERLVGKAKDLIALNDQIWAEMTAKVVGGEVRLGVPYDLVGTYLAPVIKSFYDAYPQVEVALVCGSSPQLRQKLHTGEVDLAVIEEPYGDSAGECLFVERLVWAGARAGRAHLKRPLPISLVAETCAFRPVVLEALRHHGMAWRTVFENGQIEATTATVRTDLAVTAWLASTVPADLAILEADSGLPELPEFSVNLYLPEHTVTGATLELAKHIREGLTRNRQAA